MRATMALGLLVTTPVVAAPAAACSVVHGYRVPTTLDLAVAADTIVVTEIIGERKSADAWDGTVLTRPLVLLKGATLPASADIPGAALSDKPGWVTTSDPRDLRRPNPDALRGGCVRYAFRKGTKLVLFLQRDGDGHFTPYRAPFSRDAEDVASLDALWVRAVREYAAISLLPAARRRDALRTRRVALQAKSGDADAAAIARDMAVELKGLQTPER